MFRRHTSSREYPLIFAINSATPHTVLKSSELLPLSTISPPKMPRLCHTINSETTPSSNGTIQGCAKE